MKTAKQTVKTEFEPIALGENVNVNFEQNVTGDHIVREDMFLATIQANISAISRKRTVTLPLPSRWMMSARK